LHAGLKVSYLKLCARLIKHRWPHPENSKCNSNFYYRDLWRKGTGINNWVF
jgi:hypothetical protein